MAYFAKLGLDNIVEIVHCIDNIKSMTPGGLEREDIGAEYLTSIHGHTTWKKCSYNTSKGVHALGGTPFRANHPAVGWYYSTEHDIFYPPRPTDVNGDVCNSWTLNTTTGHWEPPIDPPQLYQEQLCCSECSGWNESAYQADNTTGWGT